MSRNHHTKSKSETSINEEQEFFIGKASAEWAQKAGLEFWYEPQTTSTNDVAKAAVGSEKTSIKLYFTDHQSSGRGRGTNTWATLDEGNCLLSSWSFQVSRSPQPIMAAALGLAIYRALVASWPQLAWSLKAPNDIYLGEQKIAGLLVESVSEGAKHRLILGLGLNVFSKPELTLQAGSATCLADHLSVLSVQDWCQTLDRMLLEITMTLAGTGAELTESQQDALTSALNKSPLIQEKLLRVDAKGNLIKASGVIRWSDL